MKEVFEFLADGIDDIVGGLQTESEHDAQVPDSTGRIKMIIRLNELQNILEGFEDFKAKSVSMLPTEMQGRTEQIFNRQDTKLLSSRDHIIHSLCMLIIRHQEHKESIQIYFQSVFTNTWLTPDSAQARNPV